MYNRGLSVTTEATSNFMNALRTYCFIDGKFEAPFWITRPADAKEDEVFAEFSNGLLSLDNYKAGLRKPTHDYFTLTALPYKYDPAATCPSFLGCLDQWHPEEDAKKLLQNWAGYCFEPTQRCQVFLCSIGEAHTGKSVYSKVLVALLGEDNVSNTDLTAFDPANRFGLMPMLGKALNVTGDANDLDRPGEGTLKAITGGDRILVDRKGISPLNIYINAKLLLNANSPPPWRDRSEGIWRRMLVLMWNRVIPETDRVDGLEKWLIANELSGIFNWALEGYHRVKSEGFPVVRGGAVDQAREIVRETVQKEIQFFETCLNFTKEPGWALPCAELTKIYVRWCFKTNNKKALDERKLGMALRKWLRARYPAELAAEEAATTGGNLRFRQSDGKRAWCYAGVWVSDEWKSPEDDTS
jgi:P4 family phage/plasmid primase-like protien